MYIAPHACICICIHTNNINICLEVVEGDVYIAPHARVTRVPKALHQIDRMARMKPRRVQYLESNKGRVRRKSVALIAKSRSLTAPSYPLAY